MRFFSLLMMTFFLSGCVTLCPQPKQAVLQDQHDFCQAFEEFQSSHRIKKLQKLQSDFPDSVWAGRAETIIRYSQELDQRKAQNEKLKKTGKQQTQKIVQLKKQNQQLQEQLEQLKSLLIQLEKHPQ